VQKFKGAAFSLSLCPSVPEIFAIKVESCHKSCQIFDVFLTSKTTRCVHDYDNSGKLQCRKRLHSFMTATHGIGIEWFYGAGSKFAINKETDGSFDGKGKVWPRVIDSWHELNQTIHTSSFELSFSLSNWACFRTRQVSSCTSCVRSASKAFSLTSLWSSDSWDSFVICRRRKLCTHAQSQIDTQSIVTLSSVWFYTVSQKIHSQLWHCLLSGSTLCLKKYTVNSDIVFCLVLHCVSKNTQSIVTLSSVWFYTVSQKMHQLWNGIAQRTDWDTVRYKYSSCKRTLVAADHISHWCPSLRWVLYLSPPDRCLEPHVNFCVTPATSSQQYASKLHLSSLSSHLHSQHRRPTTY